MHKTVYKVANFLSVPVTSDQVDSLVDHLDISNFSKNQSVNCDGLKDVGILYPDGESFVRKGRHEFDEYKISFNERFDKIYFN